MPPCKPNVLALSLSRSPSASEVNGRKQLPNRWLIPVPKRRREMMASLFLPTLFPGFTLGESWSAKFTRYLTYFLSG